MSEVLPISGDLSLDAIAGVIRTAEVKAFKFVGATIEENTNMVTLAYQRPPPRAYLVPAGKPAPAGTTLTWSGKLRVSGKDADVNIYRGISAFAEPSGNLIAQIESVQSALALKVDGAPGPRTWEAIANALELPVITQSQLADARSEAVIATLLPEVWPFARALYFKVRERGIKLSLISGTRTFEEQAAIYALGRKNGKVVDKNEVRTNARSGYSNHNFGIAFDVGVFKGNNYLEDGPEYQAVGVLGEEIGLEWGGRWKSFPDPSHFQLRPEWASGMTEAAMLARLRAEHPDGLKISKTALAQLARQKPVAKTGLY